MSRRYRLEEHCLQVHGLECSYSFRCSYCKTVFDNNHRCVSHLKSCEVKFAGLDKKQKVNGATTSNATLTTTRMAASAAAAAAAAAAANEDGSSAEPTVYPCSEAVANVVYFNVPMRGKHICPLCDAHYVKRSQFSSHFTKFHLNGRSVTTLYRCVGCEATFDMRHFCNLHVRQCMPCRPHLPQTETDEMGPSSSGSNTPQRGTKRPLPLDLLVDFPQPDNKKMPPSNMPLLNDLRNLQSNSERHRLRAMASLAERRNWEPVFFEEFGRIVTRNPAQAREFIHLMPPILELFNNVLRHLAFPAQNR